MLLIFRSVYTLLGGKIKCEVGCLHVFFESIPDQNQDPDLDPKLTTKLDPVKNYFGSTALLCRTSLQEKDMVMCKGPTGTQHIQLLN
jgi:hypothetical protein